MLLGVRRGLMWRLYGRLRLARRTEDQHLLRAAAEIEESRRSAAWTMEDMLACRSWTRRALHRVLRRAWRTGHVDRKGQCYVLTPEGQRAAQQVVRNHRLWELFLMRHADIAASHVDRDADLVEHVLDDDIVAELEALLERQGSTPPSPHPIRGSA